MDRRRKAKLKNKKVEGDPDSAAHNGMLIFATNSKTWAKIAKAKDKRILRGVSDNQVIRISGKNDKYQMTKGKRENA